MAGVDTASMSDEELLEYMDNLPDEEPAEEAEAQEEEEETVEVEEEVEDDSEDIEDTETEEEDEEVADTEDADPETSETEDDEAEDESQETDEEDENEDTEEDETDDESEEAQETNDVDYKAFYESVTSDYKANGRMMPGIKDPEDLQRALSMASNYAAKTTALKPHLATVKMLEKAGISQDDLNEMIDFKNGNVDVLKKKLKEVGVDPLDIDVDQEVEYKPNDYRITEHEMDFAEVIDPIRDTPEYEKAAEVVTTVWDNKSKTQMLQNPELLKGLYEEIAMGRYETVQGIMDQRKLLGKTNGLNDLEMYQEIATELSKTAPVEQPKQEVKETVKPKPKVEDPTIKEKKKKAGINTKKKSSAVKKYDPTSMDDEEFMKLVESGATFI